MLLVAECRAEINREVRDASPGAAGASVVLVQLIDSSPLQVVLRLSKMGEALAPAAGASAENGRRREDDDLKQRYARAMGSVEESNKEFLLS